jgi:hypothetical protein
MTPRGHRAALQAETCHRGVHHHVKVGLDNVNLAAVDSVDGLLIHVDADDFDFSRGKHGSSRQSNVTKSNNGNNS